MPWRGWSALHGVNNNLLFFKICKFGYDPTTKCFMFFYGGRSIVHFFIAYIMALMRASAANGFARKVKA